MLCAVKLATCVAACAIERQPGVIQGAFVSDLATASGFGTTSPPILPIASSNACFAAVCALTSPTDCSRALYCGANESISTRNSSSATSASVRSFPNRARMALPSAAGSGAGRCDSTRACSLTHCLTEGCNFASDAPDRACISGVILRIASWPSAPCAVWWVCGSTAEFACDCARVAEPALSTRIANVAAMSAARRGLECALPRSDGYFACTASLGVCSFGSVRSATAAYQPTP
jgi:hypothetical protein